MKYFGVESATHLYTLQNFLNHKTCLPW